MGSGCGYARSRASIAEHERARARVIRESEIYVARYENDDMIRAVTRYGTALVLEPLSKWIIEQSSHGSTETPSDGGA
jgi:hypothetical protein